MAYIVLAAGAVMVLIGALAIITGYPIIQIERGWATVIAGTSLVTGGAVTMALSLILRALMDLRHAMEASAAEGAAFDYAAGATRTDRSVEPRLDAGTERPASEPSSWTRESAMLGAAAVALPVAAVALHETRGVPAAHDAEPHHADAIDELEQPVHSYEPHANEPLVPTASNETLPDEQAHETSVPNPSAPRLDDWLDRAFADLAEPAAPVATLATTQAEPEPLDVEHPDQPVKNADLIPHHADQPQQHDDHVERQDHFHEADMDMHMTAPTAPALDEPTSAVIGRYEADGTSYTMYADGSIDAQSDVGIYRFSSMAELKAFIEG